MFGKLQNWFSLFSFIGKHFFFISKKNFMDNKSIKKSMYMGDIGKLVQPDIELIMK